jgi:hypothetical protein
MDFWTIRLAEGDARDVDPSLPEEVVVEPPTPVIVEVVVPPAPAPEPTPIIVEPTRVVEPPAIEVNNQPNPVLKYVIIVLGILLILGFLLL